MGLGVLGDGSPLTSSVAGVTQGVNQNYLQNLSAQNGLNQGLFSAGMNQLQPAQGMFGQLLQQQTQLSAPAQDVVNKGSSGLFGPALGLVSQGWGAGLGSKLFSSGGGEFSLSDDELASDAAWAAGL